MKRYKAQHESKRKRKSKKDKFWSGSGKFFVLLVLLYSLIIGINEIVSIGQEEIDKFSVENIEISGNEILSREKVIEICDLKTGKDNQLDDTQINEIANKLMKTAFIKGVSITKRLPHTLNITLEERKPIAFIYGRGLNLIDENGFLIPIPDVNKSWDLPLISGIKERLGTLGKKTVSKTAMELIAIVNYVQNREAVLYSIISEIGLVNEFQLNITLARGCAKIKINRDNYKKELYILQKYVIQSLDWAELETVDYIDLRFENQLIVKKRV